MNKFIDLSTFSFKEAAAIISEEFKKEGVAVVLSGGACAQIYSKDKYVTADLDFVEQYIWHKNDKKIEEIMDRFGFRRKGRSFFNDNKNIEFSVEFPPGPLEIGEEAKIQPVELEINGYRLTTLSPTDSLKDRLTWYLHSNDLQCLQQAIWIYQMNEVDLDNIKVWAKNEGQFERYKEFEFRIKQLEQ